MRWLRRLATLPEAQARRRGQGSKLTPSLVQARWVKRPRFSIFMDLAWILTDFHGSKEAFQLCPLRFWHSKWLWKLLKCRMRFRRTCCRRFEVMTWWRRSRRSPRGRGRWLVTRSNTVNGASYDVHHGKHLCF